MSQTECHYTLAGIFTPQSYRGQHRSNLFKLIGVRNEAVIVTARWAALTRGTASPTSLNKLTRRFSAVSIAAGETMRQGECSPGSWNSKNPWYSWNSTDYRAVNKRRFISCILRQRHSLAKGKSADRQSVILLHNMMTKWAAVAQSVQCLTTDWTAELRSPTEAEDFSSNLCVQTDSGAHPASYTMGTGGSFPGG
jgi:hypothetical protein